jgi:hypothetical protein
MIWIALILSFVAGNAFMFWLIGLLSANHDPKKEGEG